jgi:hypothetical protein
VPTSRSIERVVAACGVALIAVAVAARQPWLDRHFLPSFFIPRNWYLLIETVVRIWIAGAGAGLVLGRSRFARLLLRAPMATIQVVAAAALAVVAGEVALRWIHLQPTGWLARDEEPRRQDDPYLGWVLAPARTGHTNIGGRAIEYAIDASGYRVRGADEVVDVERPSLVFAGESVMFGEGLTWEESIPAQAGALSGIQSANVAVHGYSTDQIYLRVARELPRFRQPLAVVSIFMTELFGRNLDDDRPHLGPGLVWLAAERKPRLMALAGLLVPFRRDATVERGARVTREALLGIGELARRRGAAAIVIVPQFGPEDELQRSIRTRVLRDDIPTLLVPLDPEWRLAWDRHPNARAAHIIGAAVAGRLFAPLKGALPSARISARFGVAARQNRH